MFKTIAIIGVGRMGGGIARNLCHGGFEVTVYDFNPDAVKRCTDEGAKAAASIETAVAGQELIITSLPTPEIVLGVYQENLEFSDAQAVWMDVSTIDPGSARTVCDLVEASGRQFVACPLGKGPAQANDGTLPLFVGGQKAVVDSLGNVFSCIGENVHYMGDVEASTAFKIVSNMIGMTNLSVMSEGYALCKELGVGDEAFTEALKDTGGWSAQAALRLPWIIDGDFENRFAVDLGVKDVRLAVDAAARHGVPVHVGAAGLMSLVAASAYGWGHDDVNAVAKLVLKEDTED